MSPEGDPYETDTVSSGCMCRPCWPWLPRGCRTPAGTRAARFLLRALTLAGDEEDEFMEDVLPAAIGILGPEAVLPVVLEFMPEDFLPWNVTFGLWQWPAWPAIPRIRPCGIALPRCACRR